MIDQIQYKKIGDASYDVTYFTDELETYENRTYPLTDNDKTIYQAFVPVDLNVEWEFARDCETSEQVKYFFKLPRWFTIPTPIGTYNPDWAVILENDDEENVYLVAETKDTGDQKVDLHKLRPQEQQKIKCAKAHFKIFQDVKYQVVKNPTSPKCYAITLLPRCPRLRFLQ